MLRLTLIARAQGDKDRPWGVWWSGTQQHLKHQGQACKGREDLGSRGVVCDHEGLAGRALTGQLQRVKTKREVLMNESQRNG